MLNIKKTFQLKETSETINERHQQWMEFLCNYGNRLECQQIESKSKGAVFAIMEYRRLLKNRGFGNIPFIALNTAYTQKDYSRLHSLLQELFLEPISKEQFNYILDRVNGSEDGIIKLYNKHIEDTDKRVLNVILIM